MQIGGLLRFDHFELDVREGELRKHGTRVRLPEQSLQILLLLLERRSEIVAREDICLRLWPNHTIVEYDHSINTAVRRLRRALGESAGAPRYIETVAKRGYRFIAAVEDSAGAGAAPNGRPPGVPECHYRLLEKIGEGGLGVVYRAEDLKLGRHVAVKFLKTEGAFPESARHRLEQEARAASALRHPHICTIHGLEEIEGKPAIVMELIQGETLASRLSAGGRLPVAEALRIARQIAGALAEAHQAGVVHGDLKPVNIMLTKSGVTVLDFGLARVEKSIAGTNGGTGRRSGRISGTLHYMSPEHALGQELDARSDVFSFGLVLHEMLSGRRAFDGDTAEVVIAGILNRPAPPLRGVPEPESRIVARCLAKDPGERWQSGRDLEAELDRVDRGKPVPEKRRRAIVPWLTVAGIAVSLGLAYALSGLYPRRPAIAPMRAVPLTTLPGLSTFPSFSPDGQRVAFSWVGPPRQDSHRPLNIYVKPVGNGDPVPLTDGIVDDRLPQWSPDGNRIAFQRDSPAGHALMIVPVGGGAPWKIADMGIGLAWSPDGKEIAYVAPYPPSGSGGIVVRSMETGRVRELTHPKPYAEGLVAWSPDGRQIAFMRTLTESGRDLFVVPSAGGEPKRLTFDQQITEGFAWTPDSREIVFASQRFGGPNLWRIPAEGGAPRALVSMAHHPGNPAISLRGNRLAFSESYGDSNIWQYERGKTVQASVAAPFHSPNCLICSTAEDDTPRFSPDGRKIVFVSKRTGSDEIWMADSDGRYPMQLTSIRGTPTGSPRWSPDGHWIAFDSRFMGSPDIFVISAQGGAPRQLTSETSAEVEPSWSHDGRWVYFASNRGGEYQIWKSPLEGGAARQVTQGPGIDPIESPDGERLYYFRPDADGVWTVPVGGGQERAIPQLSRLKRTRAWTVHDDGIYFYQDGPAGSHLIQFFRFETGWIITVLMPEVGPLRMSPGLDVSPDGKTLLYTRTDHSIEGLFMIENFR